jgi:L-threonylcarbamoyladenylate synthase
VTVVTVDPDSPDSAALERAASILRAGGLVAFPTETVYGLGAAAFDAAAVRAVFAAKGRPADNPLIVHVASVEALTAVAAEVPLLARELAERWWPGPLTVVVPAHPDLPPETTGGLDTVGVRMPDHPVALGLLRRAGMPVAAPSANRSGRPSPTTAAHVVADLGTSVNLVLDGGSCGVGVESTVVDARGSMPVVLREGGVTREDLGIGSGLEGDLRASPGTRYRHYRPSCEVLVAPLGSGPAMAAEVAAAGRLVGLVAPGAAPTGVRSLAAPRDADALAAALYGALRDAEHAGVDVVVVEAVPEEGIGRAVMDRLRRAAGG